MIGKWCSCSYIRGVFAVALLIASGAQAQAWKPDRAVEIVVATAPGNSPDRMARMIQKITQDKKLTDASLSVSNRPGGSNTVAWNYITQKSSDPHFMFVGTLNLSTSYLTDPARPGYRDFTPLAIMFHEYVTFVVKADSPIKSGKDLVERLKKDPSSVSFAVTSVAGANHLSTALVLKAAGIDVKKAKIVSFDSAAKGITAVLGGHIDVASASTSVPVGHLKAGTVRVIGVGAPKRLTGIYADIPTWREQGVNTVFSSYRSIFAPKGLNDAQIAYWERVLAGVDQDEGWRADAERDLLDRQFMNSRETRKYLDEFDAPLKAVLDDLGLLKK